MEFRRGFSPGRRGTKSHLELSLTPFWRNMAGRMYGFSCTVLREGEGGYDGLLAVRDVSLLRLTRERTEEHDPRKTRDALYTTSEIALRGYARKFLQIRLWSAGSLDYSASWFIPLIVVRMKRHLHLESVPFPSVTLRSANAERSSLRQGTFPLDD